MKIVYYTATTGRLYLNHTWIGNFYTDSNGILRDSETGREVLA